MEIPVFPALISAFLGLVFGVLPGILARFGLRPGAKFAVISDIAKGAAACGAAWAAGAGGFGMAVAGAFVLFAHNFSPFVRPRGCGAAVALGTALTINPLPAALWALMWLTGYGAIRRERVVGNLAGTFGTGILIATTPDPLLRLTTFPPDIPPTLITMLTLVVCLQLFLRIIPDARELFRRLREEPDEPKT